RVGFRRDVYNRDRRLLAVLDKPAHGDRIAFLEPEPEPELEPATKPEPASESESVAEHPTEAATGVLAEGNGSPNSESNAEPTPSATATAASVDVSISPLSMSISPELQRGAAGGSLSPSVATDRELSDEKLELAPALLPGLSETSTLDSRPGDVGGTETVLLLPLETVTTGSDRQTPAPRLLSQ
ncbi:MAG: hypothetical protein WBM40_08230, partial [Thiohalocapsa sp.]